MKHQVVNLGSVLACVVSVGAGMGTAFAQAEPDPNATSESGMTPAPTECPGGANCPQTQAQPAQPQPQPYYGEQPQAYQAQAQPQTFEQRYGLAISAGGGVSDWFDRNVRDETGVAGTWEVRGYVGLNQPIGLEVAYVGRASSLDPFVGPNVSSDLVGNGAEAAARFNVFRDLPVQPYGLIGIGWQRLETTGDQVTLSDNGIADSDDILQFPLAAGAAYRGWMGLYVDARFTFRPTINEDLVATQAIIVDGVPLATGTFADMDNWEVSGRIGYEF